MFRISNCSPAFEPVSMRLPEFTLLKQWRSSAQQLNPGALFYFTENAWKRDICTHIGWGQITKSNGFEQGGLLLGNVFRDPERMITFAIVEKALAGLSATGSMAYLSIGHATWNEMLDEADLYLDDQEYQLRIIGWYHTHPMTLQVFMSGTDMNTQRTFFPNYWQFAVVLNPHRQLWRSFLGGDALECSGNVIKQSFYDSWKKIAIGKSNK